MRSGRGWLDRGLLLLAVAGCSHGSSAGRQEPLESWSTESSGIRTKGGDSVTAHIQMLIAQGQLDAAEAYLVQAIAAGLMAREAATRLQEKLAERKKQQNPDSDRSDRQTLEAMKRRLGAKNLVLHRPDATESGPCPDM